MGKQFGTPFKKGADWTGNRNGRPRKTVEPPPPPPPPPPDIKELAREKSAKALETIAEERCHGKLGIRLCNDAAGRCAPCIARAALRSLEARNQQEMK